MPGPKINLIASQIVNPTTTIRNNPPMVFPTVPPRSSLQTSIVDVARKLSKHSGPCSARTASLRQLTPRTDTNEYGHNRATGTLGASHQARDGAGQFEWALQAGVRIQHRSTATWLHSRWHGQPSAPKPATDEARTPRAAASSGRRGRTASVRSRCDAKQAIRALGSTRHLPEGLPGVVVACHSPEVGRNKPTEH